MGPLGPLRLWTDGVADQAECCRSTLKGVGTNKEKSQNCEARMHCTPLSLDWRHG